MFMLNIHTGQRMTLDELKEMVSALGMQPVTAGFAMLEGEIARLNAHVRELTEEASRRAEAYDAEAQERAKEMDRVRAVFGERLKQSMAREDAVKGERDEAAARVHELTARNERLSVEMERLEAHPEVRAAKRTKLEAQKAALETQLAALAEPEEKPEPEAEPEATNKGE